MAPGTTTVLPGSSVARHAAIARHIAGTVAIGAVRRAASTANVPSTATTPSTDGARPWQRTESTISVAPTAASSAASRTTGRERNGIATTVPAPRRGVVVREEYSRAAPRVRPGARAGDARAGAARGRPAPDRYGVPSDGNGIGMASPFGGTHFSASAPHSTDRGTTPPSSAPQSR